MVVALGVPAMMVGTASASPSANGASVVVEQNGVPTHTVCADQDVILAASGFAPNRHVVLARVQIIGSGVLFTVPIHLSGGSGWVDVGTPGPDFIGLKFRVRDQVGSGDSPALQGSYSATIVAC
jgi:hypothetical protein